ncbi:MAG: nucleotide exchange factor GrpE [Endomicrobiales bacterium]
MLNQKKEDGCEAVSEAAREEKVSELEILRQSLEDRKRQAEEYFDQLLRLKAEFENYRRRSEKEKHNHLIWGKEEILLKQISLLDVLEQANRSSRTSSNIESIQKGLDLIQQEFVKMLSSEGVEAVGKAGEKFDPALHEAIEQVESPEEEGTILDVAQKGYQLNGRVIRPAKVKVAKQVKEKEEE